MPNLPATHAVQLLVPVARLLYVPAVHDVQPVVPEVSALYAPTSQSKQMDPLVYFPATQDVQNAASLAPVVL